MSMSKYKVLALDLDGTLTNSQKIITPSTRAALDAAAKAGTRILLASGRPTVGIRPLAKELDLAATGGYILSYNGGKITNCATGEVPVEIRFPSPYIEELCAFAREQGVTILTYDDRGIVTEDPEDHYVQVECMTNKIRAYRVRDLVKYVNYPVNKFLLVGEPEKLAPVEPILAKQFEGRLTVYRSTPYFLEAMPLGVDKAASLERLLRTLGLTRENLMACGDGWNDMGMIQLAGMGVAMANAVPEVKAAANFITLDNDHDGVGLAVEKFILGQ